LQHHHRPAWVRGAAQASHAVPAAATTCTSSSTHPQHKGHHQWTVEGQPAIQLRGPQQEPTAPAPLAAGGPAAAGEAAAAGHVQQTLEGGWHMFQAGVGCTLLAVVSGAP
jgi:hypothetical protein